MAMADEVDAAGVTDKDLLPVGRYERVTVKNEFENDRAEIAAVTQALRATEKACKEAVKVLKKSVIRRNKLYFHGKVLTSEDLRKVIHQTLLAEGCTGEHTIVAIDGSAIIPWGFPKYDR